MDAAQLVVVYPWNSAPGAATEAQAVRPAAAVSALPCRRGGALRLHWSHSEERPGPHHGGGEILNILLTTITTPSTSSAPASANTKAEEAEKRYMQPQHHLWTAGRRAGT